MELNREERKRLAQKKKEIGLRELAFEVSK